MRTGECDLGVRLFGVASGAMLPFQAGVNAQLADHFGMVGFDEHPATLGRVAGMLLIALGVLFVRLF